VYHCVAFTRRLNGLNGRLGEQCPVLEAPTRCKSYNRLLVGLDSAWLLGCNMTTSTAVGCIHKTSHFTSPFLFYKLPTQNEWTQNFSSNQLPPHYFFMQEQDPFIINKPIKSWLLGYHPSPISISHNLTTTTNYKLATQFISSCNSLYQLAVNKFILTNRHGWLYQGNKSDYLNIVKN